MFRCQRGELTKIVRNDSKVQYQLVDTVTTPKRDLTRYVRVVFSFRPDGASGEAVYGFFQSSQFILPFDIHLL